MSAAVLALFARVPRIGAVKTRLLGRLSAREVCDLYSTLLEHAVAAGARVWNCEREIWWAVEDPVDADTVAHHAGWRNEIQIHGDLGARMQAVFRRGHARGAPVVLYGADCPYLQTTQLEWAIASLEARTDAVLAPTLDGGYALIGLRSPCPAVFEDMRWGSAEVSAQTRARWRALGLSWSELPYGWDVDLPADYARWLRYRARGEFDGYTPR